MSSEETIKSPAPVEKSEKEQEKEEKTETTQQEEPAASGDKAESGDQPATTASRPAQPKPTVHKPDYEKDVVYLYQYSRTPLMPSLSPYCLKVESWLRLTGVKYENVDHKIKYRSKKGQLPFVEINGEEIADSAIILKELGQRFEHDLDSWLTAEQRNMAHATISMIENHLVWVYIWWRTKFPDNMIKAYKLNLQHALGSKFPNMFLNFFFRYTFARRGAKKVKAQGMGVHKPEEIEEFGKNDLKVLSEMLADKPFFFGDEPTTLDVVAFANLAQIYFMDKEVSYPLRDFMLENCANLVGLVNRMKDRCFPDWEEMCTTLDLNTHLPKPVKEEKPSEEGKQKDEKEQEKEGDKEGENELEKEGKEVEKDTDKEKEKGEGDIQKESK